MTIRTIVCIGLIALLTLAAPPASAVCYVKSDAAGSNNGTSWTNAYTDLQSAVVNYPACVQVYVARGTYTPTATNDRTISYSIKPGVFVYGGFAGTEAALGDRNLTLNHTILSGDIGVVGDTSDNSFHVVVMDGTAASGAINGATGLFDVTIRDGNANGAALGAYRDSGGGLLCRGDGVGHECSPQLGNVIFEDNQALYGGAIRNLGTAIGKSSPEITNAIFRDNSATYLGGAIYNDGTSTGASNPLIQGVSFSGNSAQNGGAIFNTGAGSGASSPTIRNVTFYANSAQLGGAIYNYGPSGGHASPVLRYVTFNQNRATSGAGGAIYNDGVGGDSAPNISGAIFWGDTATTAPNEMATQSATTPSIEYSITPECPGGAVGCINADPLLDPLRDNGGFAPSMRPQVGSPAVDAGNAANCPAFDQRGILRPQGAQCDLGAVELAGAEKKRCYANSSALPPNDGQSWGSPWSYLWQALADTTCSEVWVAKGTYIPTTVGSTDRTIALTIPPGKAVYGGFVSGATLRSQRDPKANPTILTGDIGASGGTSDNSYHVVVMDTLAAAASFTNATVLDGFTITGGNANGAGAYQSEGGGLICNGGSGYACNPTLSNLVFSANHAAANGGAMVCLGDGGACNPAVSASTFTGNSAAQGGAVTNQSASPSFVDVVFSSNTATNAGGAVLNVQNTAPVDATFTRVTFIGNTASSGGAVLNQPGPSGSPRFDSVRFISNTAYDFGGAAENRGGTARFHDVLFQDNQATFGGGAVDNVSMPSGTVTTFVDGATFIGNRSTSNSAIGGAVRILGTYDANDSITIINSTFWKNTSQGGGAALGVQAESNAATATLRNVTFYANSAVDRGGAVFLRAPTNLPATLLASDTLFWGDIGLTGAAEICVSGSSVATLDHNLIQGGCPAGAACTSTQSTDPLLGNLQYNGGFTPTLLPATNSVALDNGANCAATDQRGVARPQGAACDIGAVERRAVEDYLFNNGFDF